MDTKRRPIWTDFWSTPSVNEYYQDCFAFWAGNPVPDENFSLLKAGNLKLVSRYGGGEQNSELKEERRETKESSSIPCYITPASEVMHWSVFPEFRNNNARKEWTSYEHDYFVGDCMSNTHPVFFISHQWRSKEHPDPDGVDCALLRKVIAVLVGIAAYSEFTLRNKKSQQRRPATEHTQKEIYERLQKTMKFLQNPMAPSSDDDDEDDEDGDGDGGRDSDRGLFARFCMGVSFNQATMGPTMAMKLASDDDVSRLADVMKGVIREAFDKKEERVNHLDTRALEEEVASTKAGSLVYIWLDYSSLPQHPRSESENEYFNEALSLLFTWQHRMNTVALYQDHNDLQSYHSRLWCVCEDMCGSSSKINTLNIMKPFFKGTQDLGPFAILHFCRELRNGVPEEERTLRVTNGADIIPIMQNLSKYVKEMDSTALGNIQLGEIPLMPWIPLSTAAAIVSEVEWWSHCRKARHLERSMNKVPSVITGLIDSIMLKQILIDVCREFSTISEPLEQPEIEATRQAMQSKLDYGVRKVFHKHVFINGDNILTLITPNNRQEWMQFEENFSVLPSEWLQNIRDSLKSGGEGMLIFNFMDPYGSNLVNKPPSVIPPSAIALQVKFVTIDKLGNDNDDDLDEDKMAELMID